MQEIFSKRILMLRSVERACAVFILIFLIIGAANFIPALFGIHIELPGIISFALQWSFVLCVVFLILAAGIEGIYALKLNQ